MLKFELKLFFAGGIKLSPLSSNNCQHFLIIPYYSGLAYYRPECTASTNAQTKSFYILKGVPAQCHFEARNGKIHKRQQYPNETTCT